MLSGGCMGQARAEGQDGGPERAMGAQGADGEGEEGARLHKPFVDKDSLNTLRVDLVSWARLTEYKLTRFLSPTVLRRTHVGWDGTRMSTRFVRNVVRFSLFILIALLVVLAVTFDFYWKTRTPAETLSSAVHSQHGQIGRAHV